MDGLVRPARPRAALAAPEARRRARRIALVLSDCDGVLTDGGVYWSDGGQTLRRFDVRDGMGVERLRGVGVATAILTRSVAPAILHRAEGLVLARAYVGVMDKAAHLPTVLADLGLAAAQVAYIGDDVNDLGIARALCGEGLTAAPRGALRALRTAVHYRCRARGGRGAFREFAEWILRLRQATDDEGERA